jgi:hypothetical protein
MTKTTLCRHEWEFKRSTGGKSLVMFCARCAEEMEIKKSASGWEIAREGAT